MLRGKSYATASGEGTSKSLKSHYSAGMEADICRKSSLSLKAPIGAFPMKTLNGIRKIGMILQGMPAYQSSMSGTTHR